MRQERHIGLSRTISCLPPHTYTAWPELANDIILFAVVVTSRTMQVADLWWSLAISHSFAENPYRVQMQFTCTRLRLSHDRRCCRSSTCSFHMALRVVPRYLLPYLGNCTLYPVSRLILIIALASLYNQQWSKFLFHIPGLLFSICLVKAPLYLYRRVYLKTAYTTLHTSKAVASKLLWMICQQDYA